MTFIHLTKALFCLTAGYSMFSLSSEAAFKSSFRPVQEHPSATCVSGARSSAMIQPDDPQNYSIHAKIQKTWNGKTLPIPIEVVVCNNGPEAVDLLISNAIAKDFLIVKDVQGKRILPSKNIATNALTGEIARPGGTIDVSVSARTIQPHSSFTLRDASLESSLDLHDGQVYLLTVRQEIFVPSRKKTLVIESPPFKFRMG